MSSSSGDNGVFARLRHGLVVSCQAPVGSPMRDPSVMARIAETVVAGGAVGIRANGDADVSAIKAAIDVPIIGLVKQTDASGTLWITPNLATAESVVEAGADIVAIDATLRSPRLGPPADVLIEEVRSKLGVPVLADIDDLDAGLAAISAGAEAVATTLSGYTDGTSHSSAGPDIDLVVDLVKELECPVIAEGRYRSAGHVNEAFRAGAYAVVIGTAITDPLSITQELISSITHRDTTELNRHGDPHA